MEIISGNRYRLDGNVIVTVIKAINRSKTTFSVEIPGKGIYSVDKERLNELNSYQGPNGVREASPL